MNPAALTIRLRPRSLLETCDLGVRFVRQNLRVYAAVWLVCLGAPVTLLYAAKELFALSWLVTWSAVVVWASLAQGVFTLTFADLVFDDPVRLGSVLRRFARGFAPYLVAMALSRTVLLLGAATVLLAPRAFANGAFIPEIVLLEGMRGTTALRRGRRLSRTLGESEFWYFALAVSVVSMLTVSAETLGAGIVETTLQLGARVGSLFEQGGSLYALLGFTCAVPVLSTVRLLAYVGGRAEQDGWDVQLLFQTIAGREERPR